MQSKGIGKQLLNYAKGIKSNMRLNVYKKNIRAIQFYQREQFVIRTENTDDNTNEKEFVMDCRTGFGRQNGTMGLSK